MKQLFLKHVIREESIARDGSCYQEKFNVLDEQLYSSHLLLCAVQHF